MVQRHKRRSDQEWFNLIQRCRTSGLTDKAWCEQQHIHRSNFYYHVRRLREQACEIPDNLVTSCRDVQEVIQVDFSEPKMIPSDSKPAGYDNSPSVRLVFPCFSVEISNSASGSVIQETISALQKLC